MPPRTTPHTKIGFMDTTPVVLEGKHVRLEPLTQEHFSALTKIAFDANNWRWMPVSVVTEADLQE